MNTNIENRDIVVAALKHAAPYIRMYKGKTFVIKVGGALFKNFTNSRKFLEQVAILHQVGIRIVLVHGAGPQSTKRATELGLDTRMIKGRRVTDHDMIKIINETSRKLNTQIQEICLELGLSAVGMIGADEDLIIASRRPKVEVEGIGLVDYGFVGDIKDINHQAIQKVLDEGSLSIVSAISADAEGKTLNINADTVAAALASKLNVEKIILATGASGILENVKDPSSLVSYLDISGLKKMELDGSLADGMLPKAKSIEDAILGGVPRVHVISFSLPDSLLLEIFTNEGTGTLIVESIEALTEAEQATGN
ncbi:MAG: acetylglutamate kinase [Pseudomonadota bacterium]|nr:acetylglutamate kinase [Pseudomonadota bacterium]